ncbi:MAG: aminotransferase class I/II-fold pyridoxal phosphate-dependent enzyme [Clostridia bacterium]|nr:aminotransferase class I/II-fold pyridoxal phosphate-dependent enzyme [Clostridia bacterium]
MIESVVKHYGYILNGTVEDEKMEKAPLIKKISEYLKHNYTGFHTPGHQQGKGCETNFKGLFKCNSLQMDLTELPGLDNLRNPEGCLLNSQRLASNLFESVETFYLVNGSTVGIQASLLALNSPKGKIIIPRHAHVSVLNGLILSGGEPFIAPIKLDEEWGIPLGFNLEKLQLILEKEKNIKLILTVQPTYQGVGIVTDDLKNIIKEKGITLIADEAHGSHLYFQENIPISLQKAKADIVIHSTHKTLGAFTQASMLHVNNSRYGTLIRDALSVLQTTSPSYLLMASLDSAQSQMALEGENLVNKTFELAYLLRKEIGRIPGYEVFPTNKIPLSYCLDPSKVLISAMKLGITGWKLADILMNKYGIVVEMCDYYYVMLLLTIGHNAQDIKKVVAAFCDIWKYEKKVPLINLENWSSIYEKQVSLALTPREVYYGGKVEEKIENTQARVCGGPLTIYPPGIPCLWPGQIIEREHIEYIKWALKNKLNIQGINKDEKIFVIK